MSQQDTKDMSQYFYRASAADFMKIPGSPVAYWVSESFRDVFDRSDTLADHAEIKQGLATCNNDLFLRNWYEVNYSRIGFNQASREEAKNSNFKWFPYNKGGGFRHWYGNQESIVNWENDGIDVHQYNNLPMNYSGAPVRAKQYYFMEGITYGLISSYGFSARRVFPGSVFDVGGSMVFPDLPPNLIQGLMSSKLAEMAVTIINPTLNFQVGDIAKIPLQRDALLAISDENMKVCIDICKEDWDSFEISHEFMKNPLVQVKGYMNDSYSRYLSRCKDYVQRLQTSWESVNRNILDAYGLNEISPSVEIRKLTINFNPVYRYGDNDPENYKRFQSDTFFELVSYAIGCMMGRYSLDKPGLILASQGETLQDYLNQIPEPRFLPDEDAILPLTDQEWFPEDATFRFRDFVRIVWGGEYLQENLAFVAESLCMHAIKPKRDESALETIRRYLSTQFFKDHLRTYKKRPIYWLFSSGKHKAFECLVYLHRYNEGTLSRVRMEYVVPLQSRFQARIDDLDNSLAGDLSTSERKRLQKEQDLMRKKLDELRRFDEKLRPYADQRIQLDLDDGVKFNYGKFGDLLAEVKAVTGEKTSD